MAEADNASENSGSAKYKVYIIRIPLTPAAGLCSSLTHRKDTFVEPQLVAEPLSTRELLGKVSVWLPLAWAVSGRLLAVRNIYYYICMCVYI